MDKTKMSEHIQELCEAILRLENAEQCRAFLDDLCTYKEVEQMAKRIYSQCQFVGSTKNHKKDKNQQSSATINRVSRALSHGSGGYRSVLDGNARGASVEAGNINED